MRNYKINMYIKKIVMPKFLIKSNSKKKSANIFQTQGFTSNNTGEHKIFLDYEVGVIVAKL